MLHTHHLNTATHSDFLKQQRIDPITGEKIEEGHTIVICAACKSAFFIESWEYLGLEHCNQEETLSEITIAKSLQLVAKPLEYLPFLFRKGSYFAKEGNEGNLELVKIFLIGSLAALSFMAFVLVSTVWVGMNTSPIFGALLGLCEFGLLSFIPKLYDRFGSNQDNPKRATYIALDLKNYSIHYKKESNIIEISFDAISSIKYSLDYISFDEYVLSLTTNIEKEQQMKYYVVINQSQTCYWSKFLEELPHNIPVLNQK